MIVSDHYLINAAMKHSSVFGNPDAYLHAAKAGKVFPYPDPSAKDASIREEFEVKTGIVQNHFDYFIRHYGAHLQTAEHVDETKTEKLLINAFTGDLGPRLLERIGFFNDLPANRKDHGQIIMDGCCRNIEMLDCFVEMGVKITLEHYDALSELTDEDPVKSEIKRHLLENSENVTAVHQAVESHHLMRRNQVA